MGPAAIAAAPAPKPATGRPRRSKGDLRRAAIVEAARGLLVDEGLDAFALRELAARLGITVGNLQYYFATRDDLLEAVVRAEAVRNHAKMAELSARGGTPRERLEAVALHLAREWGGSGARVYAAMTLLGLHQPRFGKLHVEIYGEFYRRLGPLVAATRPDAGAAGVRLLVRLATSVLDGALFQVGTKGLAAAAAAAAVRLVETTPLD